MRHLTTITLTPTPCHHHQLLYTICLYLHVLSVYTCLCVCCVYMYVCWVCMYVHMCDSVICVCVCMCVWVWYMCACCVCAYKRMEEQISNEHTSGQELRLLLTSQYSVSLSSIGLVWWTSWIPSHFPGQSHCPPILCKRDPREWKKQWVITHAQMYTH